MPLQATFDLKRYDNRLAASTALASHTAYVLQEAIREHGHACVALTGGSSPTDLYASWVNDHSTSVDWRKVHFFWGDERNVPHDHPDSNMLLAQPLLDALHIPVANIHAWQTNLAPADALQDMRQVLRKLNMLDEYSFTIALFGMGEDGHVASLFPPHKPWRDLQAGFPPVARFISDSPKPPSERYTFTLPLINKSDEIHLLPFGKTKAAVIQRLINQDQSITASWLEGQAATVVWTDVPG